MKRLVVTADDVGLHPAMTAGALRAHDEGVVTAVSLAPVGADFAAAAAAVRARPRLDAGVHLTLVGGERPLSPPREVASLVGGDGTFVAGFRAFTWRCLRGALDTAQLELELRRQIRAVVDAGVRPVHLNSHQHVHVLPAVFEVVLRLAVELGVPWVRVPAEPRPGWTGARSLEMRTLNRVARAARARLRATSAVRAAGRTVGLLHAGRLTRERFLRALHDVADCAEMVTHPGADDQALAARYRWGYRWQQETAMLCDPAARRALADAGVGLCGFRDLDAAAAPGRSSTPPSNG